MTTDSADAVFVTTTVAVHYYSTISSSLIVSCFIYFCLLKPNEFYISAANLKECNNARSRHGPSLFLGMGLSTQAVLLVYSSESLAEQLRKYLRDGDVLGITT